jgi:hypothetical protein
MHGEMCLSNTLRKQANVTPFRNATETLMMGDIS